MCSRACLPPHFCTRTREQCRSPAGNILCAALTGSALSPRADLKVAPAGTGPRSEGAEGEGPRSYQHPCLPAFALTAKPWKDWGGPGQVRGEDPGWAVTTR